MFDLSYGRRGIATLSLLLLLGACSGGDEQQAPPPAVPAVTVATPLV